MMFARQVLSPALRLRVAQPQYLAKSFSTAPTSSAPPASETAIPPTQQSEVSSLQKEAKKGVRLFVGNISFSVRRDDFTKLFEPYNPLRKPYFFVDAETKRFRGKATVELPDASTAERAVQDLNEKEYLGRNLLVKINQPRPQQE